MIIIDDDETLRRREIEEAPVVIASRLFQLNEVLEFLGMKVDELRSSVDGLQWNVNMLTEQLNQREVIQ